VASLSLCLAGDAEHIAWAAEGSEILDLYAAGQYVSQNTFNSPGCIESCFSSPNWTRLQQIKKMYDPYNLFTPLDYYRTDDGHSVWGFRLLEMHLA